MSPDASGRSAPTKPVLLTSLRSAVLGDGRGDLEYLRESRGARSEWGGVYAQLVRLTGPWTVGLERDDSATDLPSSRVDASEFPGGWTSRHRWNDLDLVQVVTASVRPAGAVRQLLLRSTSDRATSVVLTSRFSPYLFPVLVEGIRPTEFDVRATSGALSVRHYGFALQATSSTAPDHLLLNHASWAGGKYRGPVDDLGTVHRLELAPGASAEIRWQVVGGLERDLRAAVEECGPLPRPPADLAAAQADADSKWTAATPELTFPDAPDLEAGYRTARAALRRLYSAPDDTMVGLVAGYPWYAAIWCRDLAVMLPAVLWLGDFDWVGRSLASVFRFQGRRTVKLLAGEPGELPMQIAPGPIFLYGTSDSTLRFPAVVDQLRRHTGDLSSVRDWVGILHRIIEWGLARTDPATGLLHHGGEAEEIDRATTDLARVRYGIDSPDTTIWDSADRREHAIDVQVLWWQALCLAAHPLGHASATDPSAAHEAMAARLRTTVRDRYVWPDEEYLYDSLREGVPVRRVRPNALRAVSAEFFEPEVARAVVRRAARPDLTTEWGVRCLSSGDPAYRPTAYHEGQVWTIATAWAADAAFAVGERDLGVQYLRTIAARYVEEGGLASECYRGDRAEPFNSCYLLGFSVAPFLTALFERLWGIHVGGIANTVRVVPAFPAHWSSAALRGLRLRDGNLDLAWSPQRLVVRWTGTSTLQVDTGSGPRPVAPGAEVALELVSPPQTS
jgi:glycogen debranching enzyme